MRIVLTGSHGLVGMQLQQYFKQQGHTLSIVPRDRSQLVQLLSGADAVVNLGGESIAKGRWTKQRKRAILESRTDLTKALVEALGQLPPDQRPQVFVSASASGYYPQWPDRMSREEDLPGTDFLSHVCVAWEQQAFRAQSLGIRTVVVRIALVLSKRAPALQKMLLPFRLGVGGPIGSGKQGFPFIHLDDLCRLILFSIEHSELSGPVNAAAPEAINQRQAAQTIGRVLHRPAWLFLPSFVLKVLFGEMSDVLLKGTQMSCQKILDAGFSFQYPTLALAIRGSLSDD